METRGSEGGNGNVQGLREKDEIEGAGLNKIAISYTVLLYG